MNTADSEIFNLNTQAAKPITLTELNQRVAFRLADSNLKNVWITAETSDLRVKAGHCYFELIEKDVTNGSIKSRIKAIIWGSSYRQIAMKFSLATGSQLASSQKIMVCGSVNYNANYGLSFIISDIEPSYTIGDIQLRRQQIINRLKEEGILEMNRQLQWKIPALRIAVISARDAAGYGDFIDQLYSSPSKIRFTTRLFPALMQGERTPTSIIQALDTISENIDNWDLVVIIRGGGATSDLTSFDDYQLAANIANFPLPVIVGIGHERDITVLDYVANTRVKTPTAAAELLISHAQDHLDRLLDIATDIHRNIVERLNGCRTQLAFIAGQLPVAPIAAVEKAGAKITRYSIALSGIVDKRINPALSRLDIIFNSLINATNVCIKNNIAALNHYRVLLKALSPEATLSRGYSITRINGKVITSADSVPDDAIIETTLDKGILITKKI